MEVMITLSHRHQSGEHMISRRPAVIKWLLANPMCKTVHTKRSLLYETSPHNPRIHKPTPPVSPAQARNQHREPPRREQQELAIMLVLEDDNRIAIQIRDISTPFDLGVIV